MDSDNRPRNGVRHSDRNHSDRNWGDSPVSTANEGHWGKKCLVICPILVLIGLACAALVDWDASDHSPKIARPPENQIMDGVSFDQLSVKQTVLKTPSGPILLQHYPTHFSKIPKFEVLPDEVAEPYFDANNPWCEGFNDGNVLATFNCAAFAVGFDIDLSPGDMLDAAPLYGYPNAVEVVFREYYQQVATVWRHGSKVHPSLEEAKIRVGDVVCFLNDQNGTRHYAHLARVHSLDGEAMFLSKMGRRGPILSTNLNFLLRHYSKTNKLLFYRVKAEHTATKP